MYQIQQYLNIHVTLPPKAIVMVAILLPEGYMQQPSSSDSDGTGDEGWGMGECQGGLVIGD